MRVRSFVGVGGTKTNPTKALFFDFAGGLPTPRTVTQHLSRGQMDRGQSCDYTATQLFVVCLHTVLFAIDLTQGHYEMNFG